MEGVGYRKGQDRMSTLLEELCVTLGCCLKPDDHARMQQMAMDDVDAFVAAFHAAEGLVEPYDKGHWRNVRWIVAKHFDRTGASGA
jgi:hypothetical protein